MKKAYTLKLNEVVEIPANDVGAVNLASTGPFQYRLETGEYNEVRHGLLRFYDGKVVEACLELEKRESSTYITLLSAQEEVILELYTQPIGEDTDDLLKYTMVLFCLSLIVFILMIFYAMIQVFGAALSFMF